MGIRPVLLLCLALPAAFWIPSQEAQEQPTSAPTSQPVEDASREAIREIVEQAGLRRSLEQYQAALHRIPLERRLLRKKTLLERMVSEPGPLRSARDLFIELLKDDDPAALFVAGEPKEPLKGTLGNLRSLRIVIEDLGEYATRRGLKAEDVEARVLVALKSKLPRLEVAEAAEDWIYVQLNVLENRLQNGEPIGWLGSVSVSFFRFAFIPASRGFLSVSTWDRGGVYGGPPEGFPSTLYERLDSLISKFAADYYRAGNP